MVSSALLPLFGIFALCVQAVPTRTNQGHGTPTSVADGVRIPIHLSPHALHPRNKELTLEELTNWLRLENNKLRVKYMPAEMRKSNYTKRQQIGLGDFSTDSYYFAQVGIGSPMDTFNVVLDTGSSDFWIVDKACNGASSCPSSMHKFDSSKSSTFKGSHAAFDVQYGSGAVKGQLGYDTVSFAGYNVSEVTFGQASHLASRTILPPASGIMGLGFQSLSSTQTQPFWEILMKEHKIQDPVFSFQLKSNLKSVLKSSDANVVNAGGVFTLGKLDDQQYRGDITWTSLPSRFGKGKNSIGYWALEMDTIKVNNEAIDLGSSRIAAIDTGTTLIGGPKSAIEEIHKRIPKARPASNQPGLEESGYFMFPCNEKFTVTLSFGGKEWPLRSDQVILSPLPGSHGMCISALFVSPSQRTSSGELVGPTWIVGDSFLKTVFSVFSYSPQRIGFASLPHSGPQTIALTSMSTGSVSGATSAMGIGGGGDGGDGGGSGPISIDSVGNLGHPSVVSTPTGLKSLQSTGMLAATPYAARFVLTILIASSIMVVAGIL